MVTNRALKQQNHHHTVQYFQAKKEECRNWVLPLLPVESVVADVIIVNIPSRNLIPILRKMEEQFTGSGEI